MDWVEENQASRPRRLNKVDDDGAEGTDSRNHSIMNVVMDHTDIGSFCTEYDGRRLAVSLRKCSGPCVKMVRRA